MDEFKYPELGTNQHYVPQLVLRNFSSGKNEFVHVFDKETGKTFKAGISKTSSEVGFYDFKFENEDLTLEPLLAGLENVSAPILKKIIETRKISHLTQEDVQVLAQFLGVQFSRTKLVRDRLLEQDQRLQEFIKNMGYSIDQVENYEPLDEEKAKEASIHLLVKHADDFAPHFLTKTWILMETTNDAPFYTSDHPIALFNHLDFGAYGNLGLGLKGIQIYFPLSSDLALAFYCPSIENDMKKALEESIENEIVLETDADKKAFSYLRDLVSAIDNGTTFKIDNENVMHINSLIVSHSGRFVYSSNENFELVKKMIADGNGSLKLKWD